MSVHQAILQAQANALWGLTQVAVLDLAISYDHVYRVELLMAAAEHMAEILLQIIQATLVPIRATTKGDPTKSLADITRGYHKVRPPPPSISIEINVLYLEVERRERRTAGGKGAVIPVAEDVLCQAVSQLKLEDLLDAASSRADRKDGELLVAICSYLRRRGENGVAYLAEKRLQEVESDGNRRNM